MYLLSIHMNKKLSFTRIEFQNCTIPAASGKKRKITNVFFHGSILFSHYIPNCLHFVVWAFICNVYSMDSEPFTFVMYGKNSSSSLSNWCLFEKFFRASLKHISKNVYLTSDESIIRWISEIQFGDNDSCLVNFAFIQHSLYCYIHTRAWNKLWFDFGWILANHIFLLNFLNWKFTF